MNLEEALELIAEQKKQAYLHSKSYLELLEEINEDLGIIEKYFSKEQGSGVLFECIAKYDRKLWSQKK